MKPLALVIENDGGTGRLLDVLLTRSGLEVDLAATGTDALVLLEHARYDLLVIDLLLPDVSGMQVLEWIARERPSWLARAIVLSSAPERPLQNVRERWPQVRVIRKPFELGAVVESAQAIAAHSEPRVPSLVEDFCRRSVAAGARAGLIVQRSGAAVEPVHAFGYRPGEVESHFPLPIDAPLPLCTAVRNARPVWLASVTTATLEYPVLAPVFEKGASRALAVVPLIREAHAIGAVGWSFREPRLFNEREQEVFTAIASTLVDGLPSAGQSASAARA